MEDPAIAFEGVSFDYGARPTLREVTFRIEPRQTVCLVGPNGGGKSTVLKLMLGLLRPAKGTIRVSGGAPERMQRRIGYMPQYLRFDPQFPVSVEEVVLAGRLKGSRPGFFGREDRAKARSIIDEMELGEVRDARFSELSGGQQQRVLIARALAVDPEILLLDEPTAMVDAHLETRLLEKIRSLHRRLTMVLVSHDAAFVAALVERVFCVNRTLSEHPASALTPETLQELYGHGVQAVRHQHPHGPNESCEDHNCGGHP